MLMLSKRRDLCVGLAAACAMIAASDLSAQAPGASLDTRAAFMQVVTNLTLKTNMVVVTNFVVVTNAAVVTNFFNAQGVLLTPVPAGLMPVPQAAAPAPVPAPVPAAPPPPPKPTPLQVVRELLAQGINDASNKLAVAGSFSSNATLQILMPPSLTSFDRRKSQALINAMNLTAEKAVPEVAAILAKAAAQFTPGDAAAVVAGASDAASRSFQDAQREDLARGILPAVQRAGIENRLNESHTSVLLKGGGLLGSVLGAGPSVDIEAYVAEGLLRGMFKQLSTQEASLRGDPASRKSPVLQEGLKK